MALRQCTRPSSPSKAWLREASRLLPASVRTSGFLFTNDVIVPLKMAIFHFREGAGVITVWSEPQGSV